ncbi:MAG: AAA family ATPase [Halolamina sp.]
MAGSVRLSVTVADGPGVAVPPTAARRLGVGDDDPIRLTAPGGGRTHAAVSVVDTVPEEEAFVGADVAEELDVDDDDSLTVEAVSVAPAERLVFAPVPKLAVRSGEGLVRESLGSTPVAEGDSTTISLFNDALDIPLRVVSAQPPGPVRVTSETRIDIEDGPAPLGASTALDPIPAAGVGGYEETVETLRSIVAATVDADGGGSTPARAGVVIAGPHGVGKTHLLRHVAFLLDASLHRVDPSQLLTAGADEVQNVLRSVGQEARGSGRGVVHLDALDAVLSEAGPALSLRLREWLDGLATTDGVAVVAELVEEEELPVDLVQGARLSRTVTVPEPSRADRADILAVAAGPAAETVDLADVAERAFGYVAADLLALWTRAVDVAADRTDADDPAAAVTADDLERALSTTDPSGVRGSVPDVASVSFDDIGGLEAAKRELIRAVDWPLTSPELFDSLDIDPPAGVLLFGPPGTGKTMLARAVASNSDANFIPVEGPELMNKYVGESERAVRRVFEQARANTPAVVFFDEIDAIGATRTDESGSPATERVVSQLLTELDGIEGRGGVTVVGTTNRPDRLDEALLRPGRFDRAVEVPLPDADDRVEILRAHVDTTSVAGVDFASLADRTEGYTGSDIAAVVREAGLLAIEDQLAGRNGRNEEVTVRAGHFEEAVDAVDPSVSEEARRRYDSFELS